MTNPYREMELLAPAGDMACLHAAVQAGADAVYLGCQDFNARRSAGNFSLDELAIACDYAHLRGVRVYLTINVVILPEELSRAVELVRQAYRRGVDAFIIQDLGLAYEVRRVLPEAVIHASTQMNIHNVEGVNAAARLGVDRVTLARELSLMEIAQICDTAHNLGMGVEVFGHGALCICYSGQCFMSSMIGGRSANRGMCAQACRLPYTMHNAAQKAPLDTPGEHLLSPKDLCTVDTLIEMGAVGVDSIKIEGRMKSAEYVHAVVGVYRQMLDRLAQATFDLAETYWPDPENPQETLTELDAADIARILRQQGICATEEQHRILAEAFTRGFTQGYLKGQRDNSIMSYGRPNNRGVFVGRVTKVSGSVVHVASEVQLHEGDLLEYWTNKGHFAETLTSLKEGPEGYQIKIEGRVGKGDRVFRVRDAEMAFQDNAFEPRIPVEGRVVMEEGQPVSVTVSALGCTVEHSGPVVEAARTKAVTPDEVYEHVDRLGNTPFVFSSLEVDVADGLGIGFSALHKARTQALKRLEEAILAPYKDRLIPKSPAVAPARPVSYPKCQVFALASNPACARAAKRAGAELVYIPAWNYRRGQACVAGQLSSTAEQAGYPSKNAIVLPEVDKPAFNQDAPFDPWDYAKAQKTVMAESFGSLVRAVDEGLQVEAGPHIPATNLRTLELMADFGVERVWLSPELSMKQIKQLGQETPLPLGLIVAGYQEVMVTEHCILMSQGPCNQRCSECPRRKSPHFIQDKKGYQFQVVTDSSGRSHLYNAVMLEACHLIGELMSAGVSAVMVDTTLMNTEQTTAVVSRAVRARDIALKGDNAVSKAEGCTTGHLFRGVQ